ncbi:hypothetical protein KQ313_00895 [Synechococcus sp. CS-1325]|uniref:hypothetical protein n=1 Tax=Synechococcus sp. CS-1325 TaxID=2847979 RepID=UPI000DB35CA3|nr:hypothetical protein [Synechococcus sp. CS-1325]MCT0198251.1 hypothetical protein [Synechococcus sp. CS-1325]PZU97835.1 MAG: hypothetical protein DCF24_11835 [Cyanobium sp.]
MEALLLRPESLARPHRPQPPQRRRRRRRDGRLASLLIGVGLAGTAVWAWSPPPQTLTTQAALDALPFQLQELWLSRAPAPPRPGDVVVASADLAPLLNSLRLADQSWRPRAIPLPGGGFRYLYKRRADDPLLTVEQIKQRLLNPPEFRSERLAITTLIPALERVGVRIVLGPPIKRGAAAEWDPPARTIRIQPGVVSNGSVEFARVLNHEAIHVAQSCRRGGPAAQPQLLGLSNQLDVQSQRHLGDPVYASASPLERALEREAYANQHRLELGIALLGKECRQRR